MRRQITSLSALESFRFAAEFESFSKAADHLNVTHGAVSRAVRLLEDDLAVPLFTRRNRAVFLTDDGRKLARAVAQGLGHIEAAVQEIRAAQAAGPVTVSCEPTLMMRWLIPRMPEFHTQPPQADVRLIAGGGPVVLGSGIDLAIRRDDFDVPPSYGMEHLFDEWIGPVCRPDLRDRFFDGAQVRPDAPLLHSRTRMSAWPTWARHAGVSIHENPDLSFEHFYFSLQAAVAGLGVAMGPWHLVQDDVAAGLLASPLGHLRDGSRYLLLRSGTGSASGAGALFRDWLSEVARQASTPQ